MTEHKDTQIAQAFLETITPEFPEAERNEENIEAYKRMINELYINSLSRGQKRKIMNKQYKFGNQVKKLLNKKK